MKRKKIVLLLLCLPLLLLGGVIGKWAIYGVAPDDTLKVPSPDGKYLATFDYWDGFLHGQTCVRLKSTGSVLPPDTIAFSNELTAVKWVGPRTLCVTWKKYFSTDTLGNSPTTWQDVHIIFVADQYPATESTGLKSWGKPGAASKNNTGVGDDDHYTITRVVRPHEAKSTPR